MVAEQKETYANSELAPHLSKKGTLVVVPSSIRDVPSMFKEGFISKAQMQGAGFVLVRGAELGLDFHRTQVNRAGTQYLHSDRNADLVSLDMEGPDYISETETSNLLTILTTPEDLQKGVEDYFLRFGRSLLWRKFEAQVQAQIEHEVQRVRTLLGQERYVPNSGWIKGVTGALMSYFTGSTLSVKKDEAFYVDFFGHHPELLQHLTQFMIENQYVYAHEWRRGDCLIYDDKLMRHGRYDPSNPKDSYFSREKHQMTMHRRRFKWKEDDLLPA